MTTTTKNSIPAPLALLEKDGTFWEVNTKNGIKTKKIAEKIYVRAYGIRVADKTHVAQLRFKIRGGGFRSEFINCDQLVWTKRSELVSTLALAGFIWPADRKEIDAIVRALHAQKPKRQFVMVSTPGWYGEDYILPDEVISKTEKKLEVFLDPNTDAQLGAYLVGAGSLKLWKEKVAKPCQKSSRLRLSVAAALAAPFLRVLDLNSFGFNLFGPSSDGKTIALIVASSVSGLLNDDGLPTWTDSETAIEDQARGHRDGILPLDETGGGSRGGVRPEEKLRNIAFALGSNRGRRLSKVYQKRNRTTVREFRIIMLSSSERSLEEIARAGGTSRLAGEDVRLIDVPASEANSAGVFDKKIKDIPGLSNVETVKRLVERLERDARHNQGFALRAMIGRFVADGSDAGALRKYMREFEKHSPVSADHRAFYRIRTSFAVVYVAAALAIDYDILPWKKTSTLKDIRKCMNLAFDVLHTHGGALSSVNQVDPSGLARKLAKRISNCKKCTIVAIKRNDAKALQTRRNAECLTINGKSYIKSKVLKTWFPKQDDRVAMKSAGLFSLNRRNDTPTIEKKIVGIEGKPRYYLIDDAALKRLSAP
jgi:hypothetical protein